MTSSVVDEIEGYIKLKEIDVIFKALLVKCFRERPEEPVAFMMDFLIERYPDIASSRFGTGSGAPKVESILSDGRELGILVQHADPETDTYLNSSLDVAALFTHIAERVVQARPENPVDFIVKTMQEVQSLELAEDEAAADFSDEGNTTPAEDMFEDFCRRGSITGRRQSVSAECDDDAESIAIHRVIKKTPEEQTEIESAMAENILFKDLGDSLKQRVIDAVFPKDFKKADVIISQDADGDNCYILREGSATVHMQYPDEPEPRLLITYGPLATFGELALMYQSCRAATISAATDCRTWALDRITFRSVVNHTVSDRRALHQNFLKGVPILSNFTDSERARVADVLEVQKFEDGDVIIKQGDEHGDKFYMLEEGSAMVKYENPNGETTMVRTYKPGDYFGELAFMTNAPRATSIYATSKSTCVTMRKISFMRLLGPCEEILRNNMEGYRVAIDKYIGGPMMVQSHIL
mmetsp:Transcript_24419/g.33653  ORF Transcript_24419/g.33653 Transcript_24419/m.33653 type:complete len:468 (+) Transcript_24419:281-1684(+)|eukprot:CAMPEP_0196588592 /NCGR_PEP_ID=MMETSP1081-20130531/61026_1 /TAXON_ID=36882 /ORGANISM="Pyramimonas amylifera, Strain CCMP720" /LENGTH=467 /DNA_ID=CAMNT_0041911125 /DNA_START=277 /DNA_END=1680 /DNA_ORIENTATION=+